MSRTELEISIHKDVLLRVRHCLCVCVRVCVCVACIASLRVFDLTNPHI